MAKGGRATLNFNFSEVEKNLNIALRRVERGTRKATLAAVQEIYRESLNQVPRDTQTLALSAYYKVTGYRSNFEGEVGYGGGSDPVNPKTKQRASSYMVVVHEDLSANHPVGKAKFLEDPLREYQSKFLRNAARIIKNESGI